MASWNCTGFLLCSNPSTCSDILCKYIVGVTSCDPNEIKAPAGYGDQRWVAQKDTLSYTIFFENDSTLATAPAQRVTIRQPLHENVDPLSFRLGDFGFGDFYFDVPENTSYYTTRLELFDSIGVDVEVTAGLDITKNEIFWIFQSINPATGIAPYDPFLGVLPVNDTLGSGQGYVNYSIQPDKNSVTGDSITAQAEIIFDINEPILTNTEYNVIDAFAPSSQLDTLSAVIDTANFVLSWSAQDDAGGCGVREYDLYVSRNDSTFFLYRSGIDTTAIWFNGLQGSTYSFYTIATDNVGNREAPKMVGDDTVAIGTIGLQPRIFLQGPYDPVTGLMSDALRAAGNLPLTEPYTALGYTTVLSEGGETISQDVLDVTGSNAIVDWIFLELRYKGDPSMVLAARPTLLQRDGDVVEVDGVSAVRIPVLPADDYYIVLKHRNHLGAMSADPVSFTASTTTYDFTADAAATSGNINGIAALADGSFGLFSGDFDRNGQVQNSDIFTMVTSLGLAGYLPGDFDMNGQVQNTDLQLYLIQNLGRGIQFPD